MLQALPHRHSQPSPYMDRLRHVSAFQVVSGGVVSGNAQDSAGQTQQVRPVLYTAAFTYRHISELRLGREAVNHALGSR